LACFFSAVEAFKDLVVVSYSEQGSSFYPLEQQEWMALYQLPGRI